jgi:hypothetical protein
MTIFLLKKTFFDLWDNLFRIMILNLGFLLSLSLVFVVPPLFSHFPAAGMVFLFMLIFWLFVYLCAASAALKEVSDYRSMSLRDFAANVQKALMPALFLFTLSGLIFFLVRLSIPVYFRFGSLAGMTAAFFYLWLCFMFFGMLQFYPAIYFRLGRHTPGSTPGLLVESLKKCAVIFFDNPLFCIFSLALNTIFVVLIIPCPCWSLLLLDEGLRLRLLKYDWLEGQKKLSGTGEGGGPAKSRSPIPWDELLAEEREKTGNRSWRDFLFPWKQ